MPYSIIRKSRLTITKHDPRFVGVKPGQIVYYHALRYRPKRLVWTKFKVVEIEDYYDTYGRKSGKPRKNYSRCIWLHPLKKTGPSPKAIDSHPNVMRYNEKLWVSGHIGHSVDYDEVFFTIGEALHSSL